MRIRTIFAFTTGAVAGASAVYLLDPDHGAVRRREAARWVGTQARDQARHGGARLADVTRQSVAAAASGFREAATPQT
jgi:gas vesicle protein